MWYERSTGATVEWHSNLLALNAGLRVARSPPGPNAADWAALLALNEHDGSLPLSASACRGQMRAIKHRVADLIPRRPQFPCRDDGRPAMQLVPIQIYWLTGRWVLLGHFRRHIQGPDANPIFEPSPILSAYQPCKGWGAPQRRARMRTGPMYHAALCGGEKAQCLITLRQRVR